MRLRSLLTVLAVAIAPSSVTARTLEVGSGKTFTQPSQAVAAAQDGDRISIAAGEYFDCSVIGRSNLIFEGTGPDTVITDKACQGKALLVITGSDVTVRNMTLTRARVPDGNGAGIRMEGQNLTVDRVRFVNNQNGILTTNNLQSTLLIRDSEFTRNGSCENRGGCAHGIYAGVLSLLRVERSTFRETREGHHIKSRSLRTEVVGCDIADGTNGTASYLVDVPNGGSVLIQGNRMEKGPRADNHSAAIMIGAEGVDRPTREIRVEDNQFRKEGDYPTAFVFNQTATEALLSGNRLSGTQVRPLRGDGTVAAR